MRATININLLFGEDQQEQWESVVEGPNQMLRVARSLVLMFPELEGMSLDSVQFYNDGVTVSRGGWERK